MAKEARRIAAVESEKMDSLERPRPHAVCSACTIACNSQDVELDVSGVEDAKFNSGSWLPKLIE